MSERGDLRVEASLNASGFRQGLDALKTHAKAFSKEVDSGMSRSWGGWGKAMVGGVIGALSFEAVRGSFESFLQRASGLRELSEQLEMGTDETQKWEKAVDRLGLSFSGLQTVINGIRDKRIEALTNPKSADLFERLGIPRRTVLDMEGVNSSAFSALVLQAMRGSEAKRAIGADIFGRRGLRYAGAADIYQGQTPDISPEAIQVAHDAELAQKRVNYGLDRMWGNLVMFAVHIKDLFGGESYDKIRQAEAAALAAAHGYSPDGKALAPSVGTVPVFPGATGPDIHDPLESVMAEKRAQWAERRATADERIEDAHRRNMNTSGKRASLQKELTELQDRETKLRGVEHPENLKSPEEIGDWNTKHYEQIAELMAKEQGIMGELRPKPIELGADGLAKSGLFSGSALNVGMGNSVERAQLDVLRSIDRHVAEHKDPHTL